jgi:hypothetical protein
MNHSLLGGFVDSIAPDLLDARFEPHENRCCVTLRALPATEKTTAAPAKTAPEAAEFG